MSRQLLLQVIPCMIAGAVFALGCGGKENPPSTQSQGADSATAPAGESGLPPVETIFEQWQVAAEQENPNLEQLTVLAGLLGQYENGHDLLFELIGDAEAPPMQKLVATISMSTYVFPDSTERLVAMTQPDHDPTTRACAAQLLSSIPEPALEARARLHELMRDDSLQVRVAAVLALAVRGDEAAISQLAPLWQEEGLNSSQRANILYALPDAGPEQYRDIYLDAVQMPDFPADLRMGLIEELSKLGDTEVRDTLAKLGETAADLEVRLMAQGAAAAMTTRMETPLSQDGE